MDLWIKVVQNPHGETLFQKAIDEVRPDETRSSGY
jgi:hypothetical protein